MADSYSSSGSSSPGEAGLLPDFCPSDAQVVEASWKSLAEASAARRFFERLDLPSVHPRCLDGGGASAAAAAGPLGADNGASSLLPPTTFNVADSAAGGDAFGVAVTAYSQVAPALLAMAELWLRLFAMVLAPLAVMYLLRDEWTSRRLKADPPAKKKKKAGTSHKTGGWMSTTTTTVVSAASVLGLASSAVLLTDTMYVHDMGRLPGGGLFVILSVLSTRAYLRHSLPRTRTLLPLLVITVLVAACLFKSEGHPDAHLVGLGEMGSTSNGVDGDGGGGGGGGGRASWDAAPHPGLDLPTIPEGLYHSASNAVMNSIAASWPEEARTYSVENGATPWTRTGDSRTGIPFLINAAPDPVSYHRLWVPTGGGTHGEDDEDEDDEEEAVALDVALPPSGVHSTTKPVYLVLHGLNGGSDEEYVREFVHRRTRDEGSTVAVMVARGLMDTPVVGWDVFHGARVEDVHAAAGALRRALSGATAGGDGEEGGDGAEGGGEGRRGQILAGVGYSMGAIILSNYVARSGPNCRLDAAMAVSGGLDMREQLNFYRSMRLWQPMLAKTLRDTFIVGKFEARYRSRLSGEQYLSLMRAAHISSIDDHAVVTYNSFDDLTHYYSEMSAMGDTSAFRGDGGGRSSARLVDNATTCAASGGSTSNNENNEGGVRVDDDDGTAQEQPPEHLGRIANVSIPFCVLHALDDPLVTWRTMGHNPRKLVESGSGHVMLLLTKSGGHVGWPLGLNPRAEGWRWMNDAVRDFVTAADGALKKQK